MSELRVDIASEFIGRKAFFEASKATNTLEKQVSKLGKSLGVALGSAAMISYGKAAVKAFAADEAAARRLATAVDNLGLSFSQAKVATFIKDLETSSNIADDILRPAFQALLTTTGSLTKSQELLNNAIQISRASGIDLATVSQDLASGYVGITRGLKKYNTGLTQAELKSKSFADILGIMLTKSAGAASAYLETTQYKLDALALASNNAKETIGKGLVDAFALMAGGTQTSDAVKAIDNIAKAINGIAVATGFAVGGLVKLYRGLDFLTSFGGLTGANGSLAGMLQSKPSTNRSKSPAGTAARTAQQRAAEAAAAKRAKELAALTVKQVKAQKELTAQQKQQTELKKAGSVFDLEQIQILAALKGNVSEEDRTRLQAQAAILNGNAVLATDLTKKILMAQDASGGLYAYFLSIGDAKIKNPFAFLDTWLEDFMNKLNNLKFPDANNPYGGNYQGNNGKRYTTSSVSQTVSSNALVQDAFNAVQAFQLASGSNAAEAAVLALDSARYTALGQAYAGYRAPTGDTIINVQVQGSVIREQELIDKVMAGTQLSSLSGSPSQIGRIAGMFG